MKKTAICIAILSVFIFACQKDEPQLVFNPTKASLNLPQFVKDYLGEPAEVTDNILTNEGIELGRKLFYDPILSNDGTMTCASCHKQENAFTDPRPFSEGTKKGDFGDRNAMVITNLAWDSNFFWDGRRQSLETQAHDPVSNPIEMNNNWKTVVSRLQIDKNYPNLFFKAFGTKTVDSNLVTKALAQFERTIISFNSRYDAYVFKGDTSIFTPSEKKGYQLFTTVAHCNDCHSDVLLADNSLRNNGLDTQPKDVGLAQFTKNVSDIGKFKVPTLRNIEVTAPYMHDSRFNTLAQVVEHYNSGVKENSPNIDEHIEPYKKGLNLTSQQKNDLVAFLKTLTDNSFLKDTRYNKPQ
jgi:cytochrome c peroxidase